MQGMPFILDTDASLYSIGGVLSQLIDGKEKVISYASKTLSATERAYCTTKRELMAVKQFLQHFDCYLNGNQFILRTDHSSIKFMYEMRDPSAQYQRWLMVMSSYDTLVVHRAEKKHLNADGMSRRPRVLCDNEYCSQCRKYKTVEACAVNSEGLRRSPRERKPSTRLKDFVCYEESSSDESVSDEETSDVNDATHESSEVDTVQGTEETVAKQAQRKEHKTVRWSEDLEQTREIPTPKWECYADIARYQDDDADIGHIKDLVKICDTKPPFETVSYL